TNRHLCDKDRYFEVICEAVSNGVENIIIREKDLNNDELKTLFNKLKYNLDKNGIKGNLIINSNVKIFEEVNADGIHLPFKIFKQILGSEYKFDSEKILGISTHSINEIIYLEKIIRDKKIKIDYITLSHIYETDCKKNLNPKGLKILKEAKKITNIKIVALGGIIPNNTHQTLSYCDDVAVMSQIMKSQNVSKIVNMYLDEYKKDAK
ncbi:thiamine phosphate synthase, partial [Romboutsia sp.]|uniref:thiamine phosphate synthase n=1 Tax=Romboutsia sp. TaxID=1965302 RepID=UPI002C54D3B5